MADALDDVWDKAKSAATATALDDVWEKAKGETAVAARPADDAPLVARSPNALGAPTDELEPMIVSAPKPVGTEPYQEPWNLKESLPAAIRAGLDEVVNAPMRLGSSLLENFGGKKGAGRDAGGVLMDTITGRDTELRHEQMAKDEAEHPKAAGLGRMGGGVASMLALGAPASAAVDTALPGLGAAALGEGWGATGARAAKQGLEWGGISAALDPEHAVSAGVSGGLGGAVLGAAAPRLKALEEGLGKIASPRVALAGRGVAEGGLLTMAPHVDETGVHWDPNAVWGNTALTTLFGQLHGPSGGLSMAQRTNRARVEEINKALPDVPIEDVVKHVGGSDAGIDPKVALRMAVAESPALSSFKAEKDAAALPPAEEMAIRTEAAKTGENPTAKIEAARAKNPVDVTAVPDVGTEPRTLTMRRGEVEVRGSGESTEWRDVGSKKWAKPSPEFKMQLDRAEAAPVEAAPENVSQEAPGADLFHGSPRTDLSHVSATPETKQYDNATSQFGAFFSPSEGGAARYAGKTGRVYPARVSLKNPYEMPWSEFNKFQSPEKQADGSATSWSEGGLAKRAEELKNKAAALRADLEARGYDGVVVKSARGQLLEVSSFKDVPLATEGAAAPTREEVIQPEAAPDSPVLSPEDLARLREPSSGPGTASDVESGYRASKAAKARRDAEPAPATILQGAREATLVGKADDGTAIYEGKNASTGEPIYYSRDSRGRLSMDPFKAKVAEAQANAAKPPPTVGDSATGTTREGEPVTGTVVRETGASLVLDDGSRIPKDSATREPPAGEFLGLAAPKPKKSKPGKREQRGALTFPQADDLAAAVSRTWRGIRPAIDWVTMKTAPNISRSNPEAGALAGSLAHTHTTSGLVAPEWRKVVLGESMTPTERAKWDQATTQYQHEAVRARAEAELAAETDPAKKAELQARLDGMYSTIGKEGDVFGSKAAFDAYWNSPETQARIKTHQDIWTGKAPLAEGLPSPEEMFKYLAEKGVATDDLVSTDPRDVMRLNEVALADAAGEPTPYAERLADDKRIFGRRSSPENIREKPHPFDKKATSAGQDYLWDYEAKVENTYRRVLDRYTQAKFIEAEKAGGWVVPVKDGKDAPEKIHGEDAVRLEPEVLAKSHIMEGGERVATAPGTHLYVAASHVPEIKQLLRLRDPVNPSRAAQALNFAALFGVSDNAWNLVLDSMITGSAPGAGMRSKPGTIAGGLINNLVASARLIWQTAWTPKGAKAQNLKLSNLGAFRGERTPEWTAESFKAQLKKSWGLTIPHTALGRLSDRLHAASRRILDDAFTALVKNGMAEDTPVNRREFINRLGQHSGRGMDRLTQVARDSAAFPFLISQKKGASEVLRKATLSGGPGTKGAAVRLAQASKILSFGLVTGIVNYIYTGDPRGRKGNAWGSMDFNEVDEHGNPVYSDLLGDLTGNRALLTATGIRAAANAARRGTPMGDSVTTSLVNSWAVKFLSSPTTGFLWRAATGRDPYYGSRSQTAAKPGENEAPLNLGFAGVSAFQPAKLALAASGMKREEDPNTADSFNEMLPSVMPKRGVRDVDTLADRIRHVQADKRTDYMISQFKNLTPEKRVAWVKEEMKSWKPEERAANLRRLYRAARKP